MGTIPKDIIPEVYQYAKKFYHGKLSLEEAKQRINRKLGMNKSTAGDYVLNLRSMLQGEKYSRTLNKYATDYYLENIYSDFGEQGIINATNSLAAHINYYEEVGNTKMVGQRELFDKYSNYGSSELDIRQQEEIISEIKNNKVSRDSLIQDLKQFKSKDTSIAILKLKGFRRDNRIIAKLKIIKNHKCQLCNQAILKKDGSYYTEAAHIKPKYEKGSEEPNNLLILCPNHHKEFDYGNKTIFKHTNKVLVFKLNGIDYSINMEIN